MLIIFDLDDTLIDTSGCITPVKLEDALLCMQGAGLALPNFSEAVEMVKRLDESSESARQTLSEFLEICGADQKYLEIGVKEIYENISLDIPVFPLEQALEVLIQLGAVHQLAIVTMGKPHQQLHKMKKAGIDTTLFSKIVVSEDQTKKPHYQSIVEELGFSSRDVVVCGDRIRTDLAPAKELGFKTVHVRWGRGRNSAGAKSDVDYTVSELPEIIEIIKNASFG